jgi:hypothetical protein
MHRFCICHTCLMLCGDFVLVLCLDVFIHVYIGCTYFNGVISLQNFTFLAQNIQ